MQQTKKRLDVALVDNGLFNSRARAQQAIKDGSIFVNGSFVSKISHKVNSSDLLEIKGKINPYVSRGGLKLEKAVKEFRVNLQDKIILDIGASTGGFTQVCLNNNAKLVYAVDVGSNQLDKSLRNNNKVISYENTNIKDVTKKHFIKGMPTLAVMDVSFISVQKIFPLIEDYINQVVFLFKPQFEVGKAHLNKKGIVLKKEVHINSLLDFKYFLENNTNYKMQNIIYSPITGGTGNIEFLINLTKDSSKISEENIIETVALAHNNLKNKKA